MVGSNDAALWTHRRPAFGRLGPAPSTSTPATDGFTPAWLPRRPLPSPQSPHPATRKSRRVWPWKATPVPHAEAHEQGGPAVRRADAVSRRSHPSQLVRREESHVDAGEARAELNDRIRQIFGGTAFETIAFPDGPFDVPDEVGDGRPKLIVLVHDGVAIGATVEGVPELIDRIHARKGAEGSAFCATIWRSRLRTRDARRKCGARPFGVWPCGR